MRLIIPISLFYNSERGIQVECRSALRASYHEPPDGLKVTARKCFNLAVPAGTHTLLQYNLWPDGHLFYLTSPALGWAPPDQSDHPDDALPGTIGLPPIAP